MTGWQIHSVRYRTARRAFAALVTVVQRDAGRLLYPVRQAGYLLGILTMVVHIGFHVSIRLMSIFTKRGLCPLYLGQVVKNHILRQLIKFI